MSTIWFMLVALMVTAYVILDGFDIGAGILHLILARDNRERRTVLAAIGPVWDGNEVWLIASGGTLFFAFPLAYAASFSGFYLPLNMVLWLLIGRAIGIEFRMHLANEVWRDFFDGVFSLSSILLAIFFGAALGNVIRGVPLAADHTFFEPLWTDWRAGLNPGILDWYTVLAAIVALVALTIHGANYLVMKTEGELNARARKVSLALWPALLVVTVLSLVATIVVHPSVLENYRRYPVAYVIPVAVAASLVCMLLSQRSRKERNAFLCSCVYLATMLVGAAFALYPVILPATAGSSLDITIYNAASGFYALSVGLIWWSLGMLVAVGYFIFVYRTFRGKVSGETEHGY